MLKIKQQLPNFAVYVEKFFEDMLNRRLARIRVMQSLYALDKAKGANYELALDLISDAFLPDLNSMVVQDRNKLAGLTKLSHSLFSDLVLNDLDIKEEIPSEDVGQVLVKAREFLRQRNKKDFEYHTLQILLDAEKTYQVYLYILNLLVGLQDKNGSALASNRAILALKNNKDLEYLTLKYGAKLDGEQITINRLYDEALKNNPHVLEYKGIVNKTLEDDLSVVKYLIKNVILKHEVSEEFFEKLYLYWSTDKEILRTMLFHTFNDFVEAQITVVERLDYRWDETKDFMKELFREAASRDKELRGYIKPFLKGWEIERVRETDIILLKVAVAELMFFPSIPVKVTINEVIEISKDYNTENSKTFINGILDSLYKSLVSKDLIKKSGRGMIDNK